MLPRTLTDRQTGLDPLLHVALFCFPATDWRTTRPQPSSCTQMERGSLIGPVSDGVYRTFSSRGLRHSVSNLVWRDCFDQQRAGQIRVLYLYPFGLEAAMTCGNF